MWLTVTLMAGSLLTACFGYNHEVPATKRNSMTAIPTATSTATPATTPREVKPEDRVRIYRSSTRLPRLPDGKPNMLWIENVASVLSHFDGMAIMPRESCSFNRMVGDWTDQDSGVNESNVISRTGIRVYPGINQCAVTLFRAAFFSGCEIKERHCAKYPCYLQLHDRDNAFGMDAWVEWGSKNLAFQNPYDTPLYLQAYIKNDEYGAPNLAIIDVYGLPQKDGITIDFESVYERIEPDEPIYQVDEQGEVKDDCYRYDDVQNANVYCYQSLREGYGVHVYRLWIKDGEVVEREAIDHVIYPAVQGIYYVKPVDDNEES